MRVFIFAGLLMVGSALSAQDAGTKRYIYGAFAAMDTNKDGKVDQAEFQRFMLARLARQAEAFDKGFAVLDVNKDGGIDKKEAAGEPALAANFTQVDADGDGKISKSELRAAMIAAQSAEAGSN